MVKIGTVIVNSETRFFVVLLIKPKPRVYEIVISWRKLTAQLQLAEPTVVPIVLRKLSTN